ncbi:hypothetical protein BDB00DRAFT_848455 [Zychaea mexicana]|uniref:uncharacterized protein n=1 Tax=Zychaea mexicana TaxID=64656 RepID=UPI0022FF1F7F|nr:uncharacterized protein BDB00DRAFT_848455 [Zychaea mexicana]KAI9488344.1 hypothetical protein BDB00DRAFT_848455 [Zychaea mexicana]
MCPYFYEIETIFGQRENISLSTVLHTGLPPSISAHASTLVPATELPAVETAVAATATEALPTNHVVDENVPCSSFFEQADSMERFLEHAAPSPEPQNEEVNSIASSRVKSGSDDDDDDDDDDDNVPRGRNFTAIYSVNEAKRRKLESKKLKLKHERLQLEKARFAEQKQQQTYASDRTKFFIELLKLGKTTDEAKQIIENVYE